MYTHICIYVYIYVWGGKERVKGVVSGETVGSGKFHAIMYVNDCLYMYV
jgi:hypothetical protein